MLEGHRRREAVDLVEFRRTDLMEEAAQTGGGEVLATSRMFEVPAERDAAMTVAVRLVQDPRLEIRIVHT